MKYMQGRESLILISYQKGKLCTKSKQIHHVQAGKLSITMYLHSQIAETLLELGDAVLNTFSPDQYHHSSDSAHGTQHT